MARYRFYSVLQNINGEVISGADVFVYISGTNVPAKVYLTKEGGSPVDQLPQLRSDGSGRVEFWVDLKDYSPQTRFRIEAVKDNWLAVLDDVKIVEEDRYVYVQSSEPQERWVGVLWFDTRYSPPLLKVWNGDSWVVGGADILDQVVTTAKIADSAVTTTKIADKAVTSVKIADNAISSIHFSSDAVAPDADKVDGYHASQMPSANTIPVADNDMALVGWKTKNVVEVIQTLTISGGSIDWDVALGNVAKVVLTQNATLNNPTNCVEGGVYLLIVKQDSTGGRTLSFGTMYVFPPGETIQPSSSADSVTIYSFVYFDGKLYGNVTKF